MAKLNLQQDALSQRLEKKQIAKVEESPKKLTQWIQKYGDITHLHPTLINAIDFDDKTFINRLYHQTDELYDAEFLELKESIKMIGLINNVYLIRYRDRYTIVSGLRRLLCIRSLMQDGIDLKLNDRVVILDTKTPLNILEAISLDENTQRKNLTILEQSYKFNQEAAKSGKTLEEILAHYKISKKQFYRIKNALNYPIELKNILEKVGPRKAELIHRIIKIEHATKPIADIILACENLEESELNLKLIHLGKSSKSIVQYKTNSKKNKITIEILAPETPAMIALYEKFKKQIEKLL